VQRHEQSLRKAGFRPDVWTRVLPNVNQELYPDFCVFHSAEEYLYDSIPFLKKNVFANSNSVCCIWSGNGEVRKGEIPKFILL